MGLDPMGLALSPLGAISRRYGAMALSPLDQADLCIYVFSQIVFVYFANPICDYILFFWISWVRVASPSFPLISTMALSPLDQADLCIYVFSQIVFVYFENPICEFLDIFLDFLGRGSKSVISSHKHHGAISSRSGGFVHLCVFTNRICVF
jgi:hypothetical protein